MRASRLTSEGGFTIIETLVAMMILSISFLGFAGVHILASKAQSLGNNQGIATFLANQQLEEMRRTAFAQISSALDVEEREGLNFVVARVVEDLGLAKKVDVLVVWQSRLGVRTLTLSSLVSQVTNP
ncbi:MAG: prepilin-type N-terminal cleavage/methylation domain-containing protein [Deltaproteobacteria bacterium]